MIFPPQGYKNISYKWLNQGMIFRPHGSYSDGESSVNLIQVTATSDEDPLKEAEPDTNTQLGVRLATNPSE